MIGPWALFVAAFVAATLVPVSSEGAFVLALAGGMPPLVALGVLLGEAGSLRAARSSSARVSVEP